MIKHFLYSSLTIIFIFLSVFVWADSGKLYKSDKLSSTLITCLTQDKYGFIWVGTEYGLSKFDGYHFTNYLHDNKDTTSISDNIITDFLVDRSGKLWIGSAKGLMQYDYHTNNFIHYNLPNHRKPRIYSIIEDHKGNILVGTAGFGLYAIKKGTNDIVPEKDYARRDSDMFFTHIYEDNRHSIWQSSHLNVFTHFTHVKGKMIINDYSSPCGAPIAFFQKKKNEILIICMEGIITFDYNTGKIRKSNYNLDSFKDKITINNAIFDHNGNLYLGTSEKGVLVAKRGTNKFIPFKVGNNSQLNLYSSYVKTIMEDKDKNIWVGSYKKGLYLINDQNVAFNSWSFTAQKYDIGSGVSSIAAGKNGDILCSVQNSGIYRFNSEGKIIGHPSSPSGIGIIYRDKQGHYWLGSGTTLYSYDIITGASVPKLNFSSDGVYCITDDGKGKLYISVYSKGLYIYDSNTNAVKIINMSQFTKHGKLCNDWIRTLTFDSKGLLWIGTSNGIECMDTKTYAFDKYGWNSLLHNIQTNYICEGDNSNMIIGTDDGLYLYNRKENKIGVFPNSEALRNKQICGIVRDHTGDIWISTSMGIWQYDKHNKTFIGHINGNGLTSHEYLQGAVLHTNNDHIAFGIGDGITYFSPDNVRHNHIQMGEVHLTKFLIGEKAVDCLQNMYEIPYSENSFSMDFSLMSYKNDDNISFQYRINGGNWISTGEGINTISFVKMKPGNYKIDVRATNNGFFSKSLKVINIHINDPWYASTWAYIIYAIIILSLAYYFISSHEQRRKVEMDEQKMKFLIDATHDIRSPLTLIMGPIKKLKERLTNAEDKQDLDTINRNAQRLLLLVNQILDERRIDKNQMHLHCQKTDIITFIKSIMRLYEFSCNERNITMRIDEHSLSSLDVFIDRINFDKVINNILSNAMKFSSDGGEIITDVNINDNNAIIKIIDNGIGIKSEDISKIFERFYQGHNNDVLNHRGTGIGLNLSRAIVQMHGGSIKASNRSDGQHGTCIMITIPLGCKHLKPEEIIKEDIDGDSPGMIIKKEARKNLHILVVDDDIEIAGYISNELGQWYHFDKAGNGKEGLSKLLSQNYDLVISDVMMPEMDGITLLKKIKSNSNISDIPVILLTSKSEVSNRLDGLKKGADAFLAKPFNMEELHILIDNLVDNVRRLKGKFSGVQTQHDNVENIELPANNDVLMERIMKCINDNISDPDFNVEKLTTEVGISRAQLHRKMKEITGISTGEFIRNIRMEQAARLIREGGANITQITYAIGFNNQSHFSTIFKKHFGLSPTEYYETNKNK
nr:response regulator [Prevotella sp.]